MSTIGNPEIGQWYTGTAGADVFQVTGLDEEAGTIEIQWSNGDVGELEAQTWAGLPLQAANAPEDWLELDEDTEAQDLSCERAAAIIDDPVALEQFAGGDSGHVTP